MADEEWARGVHPSAEGGTELTEADITEVLQLASGGFPDDGVQPKDERLSKRHVCLGACEKRLSELWRRGPASD